MKARVFSSFLVVVGLFAAALPAALQVEGAHFRPMRLALVGFDGPLAAVKKDLELSLAFVMVDPQLYPLTLKKEGVTRASLFVRDWAKLGTEGLVKAQVALQKGGLKVTLYMHEIVLGNQSQKREYRAKERSSQLSHLIANDIYQFFTGEKGFFLSRIVAMKLVEGKKQIVVLNADGSNPVIISRTAEVKVLPSFAPGEKTILFTGYRNHNAHLYQIGCDGRDLKTLASYPGLNVGPSISPNGLEMALTLSKDGDSEIYLLDRQGQNPRRLTNSPGIDTSATFSPDGKRIAFVSARSGNPHLYIMDADGSNQTRLTFQGKYNQTPKFSPNGDVLVFSGRDEFNVFDIFLFDLASKQIKRVTQNQGSNEEPAFAPGGRLIIFTSTRNGSRDLYLSTLDGGLQHRLTQDGKYWTPSFSLP